MEIIISTEIQGCGKNMYPILKEKKNIYINNFQNILSHVK